MGYFMVVKGKAVFGALLFVLVFSAGSAFGGNGQGGNNNGQGQNGTYSVPELNGGMLPSLAAILLGGTALLTTRATRTKN